ncbi:hypothetical protein AYI68_g3368 [Smittium mucronatum]|uniref:Uncharacterized protein n=1 Tax=Smittium mucronatum TaxID=133383 RepID=A0A1R0H044_9FUNG|nr:hypothetical protein AYI68_g3368 [Smittium mucronatum]
MTGRKSKKVPSFFKYTTGPTPSILKIPELNVSNFGFQIWVSLVVDLFFNYSRPTDFNQIMIVVDWLKEEARSWYDSEPDSSTVTCPAPKDAMLHQYGGTDSISNVLTPVASMKLTARSEFRILIFL